MLVAAVVLAVVVVVVGASAGSVLLAAGRAQDAADAAALAAAHGRATAPAAAARSAAAAHGAVLVACDCAGPVASVTVRVEVAARPARALGITTRTATAHARLLPLGLQTSARRHQECIKTSNSEMLGCYPCGRR